MSLFKHCVSPLERLKRKPYHRQIHALQLYGHDPQSDFIAFVMEKLVQIV